MSLSRPFIFRPVATTLLTLAVSLSGVLGYFLLPVSPLPQVDFPTIMVTGGLPGASPETMAATVATPLERQFSRIAGITEMSSSSTMGSSSITMQFDLNRNIDAAARDVQAAINAARGQLPANMPNNPTWRKYNPSDSPVVFIALLSETYTRQQMYDVAATILQQKLAQVPGVGQVGVWGGSPPAIRVSVNPTVLNQLGIGLEQVRTALFNANVNRPKGQIAGDEHSWLITASDQLHEVEDYRRLIIAYRNGAAVRLEQVADVEDSVENIRSAGLLNGRPAITMDVMRQPNANMIEVADRVRALLPQLESQIPEGIDLQLMIDRTTVIRASVHDVQLTLLISVALVIMVVYLFLGDLRSTFIPSVAVPVSLLGTFGVMYLVGFSINNLTLMAMTISTGFVVDDAIVVMENITRYLERGDSPLRAALRGAKEIGFTVLSISVSLVAVFIPILLMQGLVGRLFKEFAITLSVAIAVSLFVSLTTTPMMCAVLLKPHDASAGPRRRTWTEWFFDGVLWAYAGSLRWVLRRQFATLVFTVALVGATAYLYVIIPKGFFPQQDNGRLIGSVQADQNTSFQTMRTILEQAVKVVGEDPAVEVVSGSVGGGSFGGSSNTARFFCALKPLHERQKPGEPLMTADKVIARIRSQSSKIAGAVLMMKPAEDLRVGGRGSAAQFQYTLSGDTLDELNEWAPKLLTALRKIPGMVDVNVDQQSRGLQTRLEIDRQLASRLGVTFSAIDNSLYDAFGQRQVSRMYRAQNQYNVVMEVQPEFSQGPEALRYLYVSGTNNSRVPLKALYQESSKNVALSVNHSGLFPSVTLSFNLTPGTSLGDVVPRIEQASRELGLPTSIQGKFEGTAQVFQESLRNQPVLILAALLAVYIVLGILYESYIHPLTILSTLPSAGVGALLALLLCGIPLDVMGIIGILLLIGIVKKNAIMMIDFALDAEREEGQPPEEAIYNACLHRFRPITMTTMAALLGGLPLALGTGIGSELRRPMGIAIVGGLILSQLLTLYTTPVVYLYLDRVRLWWARNHRKAAEAQSLL
ncbi:MAG TPA: multidrug efflux RND transporter permease subunit [Planctomycetaceae bacterium]|nr:multidrug efflux RND transporter permease subunit [Planctomycetaceae bacterium]